MLVGGCWRMSGAWRCSHQPGPASAAAAATLRLMLLPPLPLLQGFCPCEDHCTNQVFSKKQFAKLDVVRAGRD